MVIGVSGPGRALPPYISEIAVLFWPTARLIFSLRATAPHLGGWVGGEEHEAARSWMGRLLGAGTEPDEVGESPTGGRPSVPW